MSARSTHSLAMQPYAYRIPEVGHIHHMPVGITLVGIYGILFSDIAVARHEQPVAVEAQFCTRATQAVEFFSGIVCTLTAAHVLFLTGSKGIAPFLVGDPVKRVGGKRRDYQVVKLCENPAPAKGHTTFRGKP